MNDHSQPADARTRTSTLRSFVRRVGLLGASVAGLLTLAGVSGVMERIFYFPSRTPFVTPPGVEDASFNTGDGLTLHGWFAPAQGVTDPRHAPTVLHVHGNAGNVSNHFWYSEFLTERGVNVFLFDYRSFGRSEPARRSLRREDVLLDAHAALDYLLTRPDVDPARIGVYGVSLGASIALALAADRPEIRAAVSAEGFASWERIASDKVPIFGALLVRSGLDATDSVKRLGDRPLLIVHGERDRIVPVRHASMIERAAHDAGVRVELFISPRVGHNDLIDDPALRDRIAAFLLRELD